MRTLCVIGVLTFVFPLLSATAVAQAAIGPDNDDARKRKADDLYAEAYELVDRGDAAGYRSALPKYREARLIYRDLTDLKSEAYTLYEVAYVLNKLGLFEDASKEARQTLVLFRLLKNEPKGEAMTLNLLGSILQDQGDARSALQFLQKSLQRRPPNDLPGRGVTLNNIGSSYFQLGRYRDALDAFLEAVKLRDEAGDLAGVAQTTGNLGAVYFVLGEDQQALRNLQQAYELQEIAGDMRGAAASLSIIGSIYVAGNELTEAEKYFRLSLQFRVKAGDRAGEARSLSKLGDVSARLGFLERSSEQYADALKIMEDLGDRAGIALVKTNIGIQYLDDGRLEKARETLNEAFALARETGDIREQSECLAALMAVEVSGGRPAEAILNGKQAVNLLQELRYQIRSFDQEVQSSFRRGVENTYRILIELLVKSSRTAEAEQVLRMLKDEEYFQFVGDRSASGTAVRERIWFNAGEHAMLARRGARIAQVSGQIPKGTRSIVKGWNDKGAVLVATVVGENALSIIVTTDKGQRGYVIPVSESALRKMVQDFRSTVLGAKFGDTDASLPAQTLYDHLVRPIERDLREARARTVVWSLDKFLRYLPTAALWDRHEGYFVEKYSSVVLALAGTRNLGQRPLGKTRWRALGIGVSRGTDNLEPLQNVSSELEAIVREGGARDTRGLISGVRLMDDSATYSAIRDRLSSRAFRLTHAATHFVFVPGTKAEGLGSYLLLGGGEKLTLSDLQRSPDIFAGTELLTLSACDTGFGGTTADGREIEGLGVLAQRKGANAILATLWPVADESTGQFMTEFYRAYAKTQLSKAESLRRAQLKFLSTAKQGSSDRLGNPYYWSPFILIGNWR